MSFEVKCAGCGAATGPSVGVCPYCKSVMRAGSRGSGSEQAANPALGTIQKAFDDGRLEEALSLASFAETKAPEVSGHAAFLVLYARILIESEAPSSKVGSVLNLALLREPGSPDAADYLELVAAKAELSTCVESRGEARIRKLLQRRPDMDLAYFLLGAHLFWLHHEAVESPRLLERCVQLRPNFLRAWGCLGSIFQRLGAKAPAARAFQNCLRLETHAQMRRFFEEQLQQLTH